MKRTSLEHITPASCEWEQAFPIEEIDLLHSVRLFSVPAHLTLLYQDGPLPAPKVADLGAPTALRNPN